MSIQRGSAEFVRTLHADHEEADTRLLLHAQHAAKDGARVVIQSPDTDVLVLSVSHCEEIGCQELWFRTGVKERIRYIPVHKIAARLGRPMCKAIPAFHALIGCDTTRSLSGIGKKNAWKVLCRDESHQESLARFGLTPNIDRSTAAQTEAFICSLYRSPKEPISTTDELRNSMFCHKKQSSESQSFAPLSEV